MNEVLQGFKLDAKDVEILINICFGLIAGIIASAAYTLGNRKKGSSKNFAITLLLLPAIVTVVIPLIATDLKKAISLAGIFALVRFRSIPGDSKDILFIFFSLAVGIAISLEYYYVALAILLLVSVLYVLLQNLLKVQSSRILKITVPEDMNYAGAFDDIFEKYLVSSKLKEVKTSNMGSLFTLSYDVKIKDDSSLKEFFDEIRTRNGNLNIVLQSYDPEENRL